MRSLEALMECCGQTHFHHHNSTVAADRMTGTASWSCLHCGRVWEATVTLAIKVDKPDLIDQRRQRAANEMRGTR